MLTLAIRNWKFFAGWPVGAFLMWTYALAFMVPDARQEGREAERAAANARAIQIIQERQEIDETVDRMSPADICTELGGLLRDGSCT